MKKIVLGLGILSLNLFANQVNIDNCAEYRLGNSDTYILTCDDAKYKVKYKDFNKNEVIEFTELGKTKKYDRTPAKGGEMQRAHNKTY